MRVCACVCVCVFVCALVCVFVCVCVDILSVCVVCKFLLCVFRRFFLLVLYHVPFASVAPAVDIADC